MIIERAMIHRLRREFNRVAAKAGKAYAESGSSQIAVLATRNHAENIGKLLAKGYSLSIKGTADYVIDQAKKLGKCLCDSPEKKDVEGTVSRLIQSWITSNALLQSTTIAKTSRNIVRDAISKGAKEGLGQNAIGKLIKDSLGGSISTNRSRMIARTETHNASQNASLQITKQIPLPPMNKVWVAVGDKRTRDAHRDVNKNNGPIGLNELFKVDRSRMNRPGDPSGGAENVINCRCSLVYEEKF